MNYRHTEPKLCHRRRQIETPTVFNNVEEIPGAKEKFLSSSPRPGKHVLTELNGGGQSCYVQRGTDPRAPAYSVAHITNLLSHNHLWHRPQASSV